MRFFLIPIWITNLFGRMLNVDIQKYVYSYMSKNDNWRLISWWNTMESHGKHVSIIHIYFVDGPIWSVYIVRTSFAMWSNLLCIPDCRKEKCAGQGADECAFDRKKKLRSFWWVIDVSKRQKNWIWGNYYYFFFFVISKWVYRLYRHLQRSRLILFTFSRVPGSVKTNLLWFHFAHLL